MAIKFTSKGSTFSNVGTFLSASTGSKLRVLWCASLFEADELRRVVGFEPLQNDGMPTEGGDPSAP